jgi:hypothetical protein
VTVCHLVRHWRKAAADGSLEAIVDDPRAQWLQRVSCQPWCLINPSLIKPCQACM